MNREEQYTDMEAPIVGGNWNNSTNAGVLALYVYGGRAHSSGSVGGRDSVSIPETRIRETGNRGICCSALSEINTGAVSSSSFDRQRPAKRIGNLYNSAFTEEALFAAFLDARAGKRKKRSTLEFESRAGGNIRDLHDELMSGEYNPRPYMTFDVFEPKRRTIYAPHFRDLVVQHAVYRVIYDIFDKTFIDQAFACRKGKGTHAASAYTQKEMRGYDGGLYYLKLDIRRFFYSIDRDILRLMFERRIKDRRFVDLMMTFARMHTPVGIPIGNLLSQIYASVYMNPLDHYCKRELKAKSYVRYVDDFIIMGITLDDAKRMKDSIESFIRERLHLEYSHWTISKIKHGINFVGYRTWRNTRFVRKHSMFKFRRAVNAGRIESVASLVGHAKGTNTIPYFKSLLAESGIINSIPKRSRQCLNM